jgi:homoserine O-succinyltransferase
VPHGYFDEETVEALIALRERALTDRREELLAEFPLEKAAARVTNTWRSTAETLYRNWLAYIRAQKEKDAFDAFSADAVAGAAGADADRTGTGVAPVHR